MHRAHQFGGKWDGWKKGDFAKMKAYAQPIPEDQQDPAAEGADDDERRKREQEYRSCEETCGELSFAQFCNRLESTYAICKSRSVELPWKFNEI